jgi:DNA-binding transcriptional LysR family regulator
MHPAREGSLVLSVTGPGADGRETCDVVDIGPRRGTDLAEIPIRYRQRRGPSAGRTSSRQCQALAAVALAGLGIAALPNFPVDEHLVAGRPVAIPTDYLLPEAGIFVVHPPGEHPACKVRILTELLIDHFGSA